MDEKYEYLFIGTIIGIALVLVIGWYIKSTEPPPTLIDCLKACEEEGWNRTKAWIKECNNACLKKYRNK